MLNILSKKWANKETLKTFIAWCIIYSATTIFSSTWQLISGSETDTNAHILFRGLVIFIALAFVQAFHLFKSNNTVLAIIIHYCITMGLVFASVWCMGFYLELSRYAYRDIFINYTGVYIIVTAVIIIINKISHHHNANIQTK